MTLVTGRGFNLRSMKALADEPWITSDTLVADTAVKATPGIVGGIVAVETASGAAVLSIEDGSGGDVLATIVLAADEEKEVSFPTPGIHAPTSIYVDIESGSASFELQYK